jgi:Zn-dependent metalloprotease
LTATRDRHELIVLPFTVHSQSYTDRRTLTSHVYIRQIVNGLEVTDGDINVNVDRHGKVLSWGSSVSLIVPTRPLI